MHPWGIAPRCTALYCLVLASVFSSGLPAQPSPSDIAVDDAARAFAAAGCGACHGSDGAGSAAGPRIAAEDLTLSEFIGAVRRPLRTMPAFSAEVLPDQSVEQLYTFLESQAVPARATGRADTGARLFAAYGCYSCHANEAQGGMHGPRLGPDPITFARFSWYVRHPSASMPPYSESVLTDQDIADIYAFVESRPQPPPLSSLPLLAP